MIKLLIVLFLTLLSSCFYRGGGQSKDLDSNPKWMPMWMRKSWIRDWLCPACVLVSLLLFWQPSSLLGWIMLLPFYALSGAASSTYWDFVNKGEANFYLHGFMIGLAGFCLITFVPWWILTLRLIICTVGMGWISAKSDVDFIEEFSRGALFVL
jgi:hypothetical protein